VADQEKSKVEEQTEELQTFKIDDIVEPEELKYSEDELNPQDLEIAKKHGMVEEGEEKEKDGGDEKQPEPETKEDTGSEESEEESEEKELDFDEVEKDEGKLDKYNKNEKGLYFRWKKDKRLRQSAQKELEEMKASSELGSIKDSVSSKRLKAIEDALGKEDLTVDKIQALINGSVPEIPEEEKTYTKSEIEDMRKAEDAKTTKQQEALSGRLALAEQIGKNEYDNFDDIVNLAQEVIKEDADYADILNKALYDPNVDEDKLVAKVVKIARVSPKFKDLGKKVSPEEKEKVDRAIKNSKKRSSASLSRSGSSRMVNEDDLTAEDAARMNVTDYMKLKKSTRDRLLGKPS